jgi:hypothetical protein
MAAAPGKTRHPANQQGYQYNVQSVFYHDSSFVVKQRYRLINPPDRLNPNHIFNGMLFAGVTDCNKL